MPYLIVVPREERVLHSHLRHVMEEPGQVGVIFDRRVGERRGLSEPVAGESRRADRRVWDNNPAEIPVSPDAGFRIFSVPALRVA